MKTQMKSSLLIFAGILLLNVWTPVLEDGKQRPVMVWLHGGGYTAGSSCEMPSYEGESLAGGEDVVVVSINHRLNVLGFLDLSAVDDQYAQSANVGMMDIVAAPTLF
jgi:para-nitrobenzyl esterase